MDENLSSPPHGEAVVLPSIEAVVPPPSEAIVLPLSVLSKSWCLCDLVAKIFCHKMQKNYT
jgi:hypothetical protein